ncbi:DUF4166 domain-containing protein [Maricaulis parjimensis]|uniref:DUF4166 domain-containing protein n=1 Tax=Maricaulis parjimensis TaxID=144023 RepID=UPI00193A18B2|nr:DUF4166 domain-containing protein [Maricaulis parjimensis]
MTDTARLYQELLGEAWSTLPATTRALHSPEPDAVFEGEADIERGESPAAWWLGMALRLPAAGEAVPARVRVTRDGSGEWLERWYGGRRFATFQDRSGAALAEDFGPFRLFFQISGDPEGLCFHQQRVTLWGWPLPKMLAPRVEASERTAAGHHLFDVRLSLPGFGTIIHYRGKLRPA